MPNLLTSNYLILLFKNNFSFHTTQKVLQQTEENTYKQLIRDNEAQHTFTQCKYTQSEGPLIYSGTCHEY